MNTFLPSAILTALYTSAAFAAQTSNKPEREQWFMD